MPAEHSASRGRMPALALAVLAAVSACGAPPIQPFSYVPKLPRQRAPVIDASVIVLPFEDVRLGKTSNQLGWAVLPLCPAGWATLETPELMYFHGFHDARLFFRPSRDLSRAVADELANAKLFRSARAGYRAADADFALEGEVHLTTYEMTLWSYGVSVFMVVPWALHAPFQTATSRLQLRLHLRRTSDQQLVWSKLIDEEASATTYGNLRLALTLGSRVKLDEAGIRFGEALQQGLAKAITEIEQLAPQLQPR